MTTGMVSKGLNAQPGPLPVNSMLILVQCLPPEPSGFGRYVAVPMAVKKQSGPNEPVAAAMYVPRSPDELVLPGLRRTTGYGCTARKVPEIGSCSTKKPGPFDPNGGSLVGIGCGLGSGSGRRAWPTPISRGAIFLKSIVMPLRVKGVLEISVRLFLARTKFVATSEVMNSLAA